MAELLSVPEDERLLSVPEDERLLSVPEDERLLSVPEDERGGFVTALSEAGILPPDQVIKLLTIRLTTLDKANNAQQADLKLWAERLPRMLLVETEYQLAMRLAQTTWVRGLLRELVEGTMEGMDI